eukprot:4287888-Pleurochrysis_carterae.AAC.1
MLDELPRARIIRQLRAEKAAEAAAASAEGAAQGTGQARPTQRPEGRRLSFEDEAQAPQSVTGVRPREPGGLRRRGLGNHLFKW